MISPSSRWAPHLSVLLAVALVPVALHAYLGMSAEDCAHPPALAPPWPPRDAPVPGISYLEERMKPSHWREGKLRSTGGSPLKYVIARGVDAKHIYYRPEYKLVTPRRPFSHDDEWIPDESGPLPVHRPRYRRQIYDPLVPMVAYLLVYDGHPVENPYREQLLSAPGLVFRGRMPATLLFVSGLVSPGEVESAEARAYDWLREARRNYRDVCSL